MRSTAVVGRSVRLIGVLALGALCMAHEGFGQESDPHGAAIGAGSVVAPSTWLNVNVPLQERVALKLYGFFVGGELDVPSAQVDLPVRATKFLTITPSYLYYSIPADGLDELANVSGAFSDSYDEHQFRVDATVGFAVGGFRIAGRNMYVRRFRPAPAEDSNRYRARIGTAYPLLVSGHLWRPFASYEAYYDRGAGGWNKNRLWSGLTVPLTKRVSVEPSYLWERSDGLKDINYLLFGLIVNTK
jgi:hypothetical protein